MTDAEFMKLIDVADNIIPNDEATIEQMMIWKENYKRGYRDGYNDAVLKVFSYLDTLRKGNENGK